jgi:hypothetical protein
VLKIPKPVPASAEISISLTVMILIDALEDNEDLIKYAYVDLEELIKGNKND